MTGAVPPTQRLLTVVAAVVLIVLAVILLAGPSNVLVLLNLKDLETEPPLDHVPDIRTRMTLDELRARVVNTRPRLESFRGFPGAEQELGGMRFCIYGWNPALRWSSSWTGTRSARSRCTRQRTSRTASALRTVLRQPCLICLWRDRSRRQKGL